MRFTLATLFKFAHWLCIYLFYIIYCQCPAAPPPHPIPLFLTRKFQKAGNYFVLLSSLIYSNCLKQCLRNSRCQISFCWITWMHRCTCYFTFLFSHVLPYVWRILIHSSPLRIDTFLLQTFLVYLLVSPTSWVRGNTSYVIFLCPSPNTYQTIRGNSTDLNNVVFQGNGINS